MSFLESIQHGLEKASQEAARIAKIQHLHNVVTDLNFKVSQQGQNLVAKAMDMYQQGVLAQGELTTICHQITEYQQQLKEVQEELQRLQTAEDAAAQQAAPAVPAPAGYPGYPPAPPAQAYAAGTVPPGYPAYPAPAVYPPYAPPAGYPGYSPASPAQPVPPQAPAAPAQPDPAPTPAAPASSTPAEKPHTRSHASAQHAASAPPADGKEATSTATHGSYQQGVLPPVFSPFTAHPDTPSPAEPAKAGEAPDQDKKKA